MTVRYVNRETDRFTALGSDGQTYTVVESTEFVHVTTIHPDPQPTPEPGMRTLKVYPSGDHVNLENGQMVVVRTQVKLTRV